MRTMIVTRHAATAAFIRAEARLPDDTPVLASASPDDVYGAIVYGNLPMALARDAAVYYAVEFRHSPPRGNEYTLDEMYSCGAYLRRYVVKEGREEEELFHPDGLPFLVVRGCRVLTPEQDEAEAEARRAELDAENREHAAAKRRKQRPY